MSRASVSPVSSPLLAVSSAVIRAVIRGLASAFCWATALYAFIASSSFAYLQFIKPRVFAWVGTFADAHGRLSWLWLGLIIALAAPHLRADRSRRLPAAAFVIVSAALVIASSVTALVPTLRDDERSVVVGVLALVPLLWLAALEHVESWTALTRNTALLRDVGEQDGRLFAASLTTACVLTGAYAVLASLSVSRAFEPDLLAAGLAIGVGASLLGHLLVFTAVFVVLALSTRISRSVAVQYSLLLLAATLLFAGLFARFVGDSIGMTGARSHLAAFVAGLTMASTWGGIRLSSHNRRHEAVTTGVDVFLSAPSSAVPGRTVLLAVASVLPLAWVFALAAGRIDWDFALLKSGVVAVWLLTFALIYRASQVRPVSTIALAVACGLPLAIHAAWHPSESQAHGLERYAVHNPSWLLADGLLHERNQSQPFDRYLRANTGLTDMQVAPVSIDLTAAPMVPANQTPSIFLFVVDSLRADYLSPYNPDVRFTPNIAAFAARNTFFPNAFTRYGGTGLSMPAIWAGSALAHKQYVTPFDSMNSLQRLVDLNGHQRIQTRDHITDALWTRRPEDIELDRGKNEMDFDFCGTLDELGQTLDRGVARDTPIFAQTRSLNLHVAAVRNGYVPPDKHYPSTFEAPYAYRVERIDACFGAFIQRLERLDLYDHSIVILTADHGELIGEDGRWGHSYHMFPQVIQVPLFIHLPNDRPAADVDRDAVALSTDITPTIYEALGYEVSQSSALAGLPLMTAVDGERDDVGRRGEPDEINRRRRETISSASYGAVYAVVSRNGRRLFIADAIQEDDRSYRRQSLSDLRWTEVPVDEGTRMLEQLRIRRFIDEIARTYHFDRRF